MSYILYLFVLTYPWLSAVNSLFRRFTPYPCRLTFVSRNDTARLVTDERRDASEAACYGNFDGSAGSGLRNLRFFRLPDGQSRFGAAQSRRGSCTVTTVSRWRRLYVARPLNGPSGTEVASRNRIIRDLNTLNRNDESGSR